MPQDIPDLLHMVESFANSADVETGEDDFDSTPRFGRWLVAHGYPSAAGPDEEQLAFAVGLRAALWDELMAHHGGGDPDEASQARARLDDTPPEWRCGPSSARDRPPWPGSARASGR